MLKNTIFNLVLLSLLLVGAGPQHARSETVTEQLANGITVTADYRHGEATKPAILVLHGFLTTYSFNTVQVIVNEMADAGYTVLAPTLSLGISSRNTSLPCDAIHTHTMDMDLEEIAFWTNWLAHKGANRIILIGHSSGSLQLVIYASRRPHPAVSKVIATSLVNMPQYGTPDIIAKDIAEAEQMAKLRAPPLRSFNMVYCSNYLATPQAYLSYIQWSNAAVLEAVNKRQVPIFTIMGGNDNRFGEEWFSALRTTGITVKVIPGANHFFDAAHEFDLMDEIKNCIAATTSSPSRQPEPSR